MEGKTNNRDMDKTVEKEKFDNPLKTQEKKVFRLLSSKHNYYEPKECSKALKVSL